MLVLRTEKSNGVRRSRSLNINLQDKVYGDSVNMSAEHYLTWPPALLVFLVNKAQCIFQSTARLSVMKYSHNCDGIFKQFLHCDINMYLTCISCELRWFSVGDLTLNKLSSSVFPRSLLHSSVPSFLHSFICAFARFIIVIIISKCQQTERSNKFLSKHISRSGQNVCWDHSNCTDSEHPFISVLETSDRSAVQTSIRRENG